MIEGDETNSWAPTGISHSAVNTYTINYIFIDTKLTAATLYGFTGVPILKNSYRGICYGLLCNTALSVARKDE